MKRFLTVLLSLCMMFACISIEVSAQCDHQWLESYRDNGDGTHSGICSSCGECVSEEHVTHVSDLGDGTHAYVCYACEGLVGELQAHTFSSETGLCTVCWAVCPHSDYDQNKICTECGKMIKAELFLFAMKAGGTVKLTEDVDMESYVLFIENEVILDLNGNTLSSSCDYGMMSVVEGKSLTICDSSVAQSGSIRFMGTNTPCAISNGGTLIIQGGTLESFGQYNGVIDNSGSLHITGGALTGTNLAIYAYSSAVVISGGIISGGNHAISVAGGSVIVTENSVINGELLSDFAYIDGALDISDAQNSMGWTIEKVEIEDISASELNLKMPVGCKLTWSDNVATVEACTDHNFALSGDKLVCVTCMLPYSDYESDAPGDGEVGEPAMPAPEGWVLENGNWVFYENGIKVTNQWRKDSKGWCYLGSNGAMLTNQWLQDSQGWCYIGPDGYCETNCWKNDGHGWIYLNSEGSMTKNTWVYDGAWYFFDENGYMVTNQWRKDSAGWCYLGSSGAMLTNQWLQDSKGWCYIGSNGYCETNCWKQDSYGWLYLDSEGSMTKNEWILDNGDWYYLDDEGYMVTGDHQIDGTWYSFNNSGIWVA